MQKGLSAIKKTYLLETNRVPSVLLKRFFSSELELLDNTLSCVQTRPRIGMRSNGFRLEPASYNQLLRVLANRGRRGYDGFILNGRKPPTIPSWSELYDPDAFYSLTDFEILAVCFRVEVENFLYQLQQFYQFNQRRPARFNGRPPVVPHPPRIRCSQASQSDGDGPWLSFQMNSNSAPPPLQPQAAEQYNMHDGTPISSDPSGETSNTVSIQTIDQSSDPSNCPVASTISTSDDSEVQATHDANPDAPSITAAFIEGQTVLPVEGNNLTSSMVNTPARMAVPNATTQCPVQPFPDCGVGVVLLWNSNHPTDILSSYFQVPRPRVVEGIG
ncbi:hypothetical protein C8F04DRAFT_1186422 [Mycena alexandri]|uniref:Uncharacterized protein n=1 Tax=Mycena alexandri TaxID=1745969 RepID=A0AAD6SQM3_9AGAR|nr:hypothetical protein C8F04DRAFT_1186422 [Mycena alexandri]